MPGQRAKCTNFGNCTKADSGDFIDIPIGGTPVCPICGKPLEILNSSAGRRSPAGLIIFIVLVAVGSLCVLAYRHFEAVHGTGGTAGTASGSVSAPTLNPGDALMYFERSDEKWLRQAADDYNSRHSSGPRIVLDYRGSREGKQDILYGKGQPVIWNPADTYWVDKLNMDWTNPAVGKHSDPVITDTRTIVSTRLVMVFTSDRASVFQAAMNEPKYQGKTWYLLYDIATKGWSDIGGSPSWGKHKFVQSDPTKSNGGMTSVALMYNEYRKNHQDASTSSPGFLKFMRGIEGAVVKFPDTTSKDLEALNQSNGAIDMAIAYEQNAIAAINKGQTDIKVVYPDPTAEIDFPGAVLNSAWVTSDEKTMADSFLDYLLTRDVQTQALKMGFRPAIADMRSDTDDELSTGALGSAGLSLDPPTVVRPVGTKLIDDLLFQWYKIYGAANGD